jgi:pimeloyl-ACP methyl ester carboxylesterase
MVDAAFRCDGGDWMQGNAGDTTLVRTPDGRQLAVCWWGVPDGRPIFVLHGSPGSRFLRHVGSGYIDHGAQVITYDRPGYGMSTRMPGRRVVDAANDVEVIADALGVAKFGVVGISGGAPCALAAAAMLPGRVTRCATVVGDAPFTASDLDFFAGLDEDERAGWHRALAGAEALEARGKVLFADVDGLASALASADGFSGVDAEMWQQMLRESLRQGPCGWVDDGLAEVTDWGFDLGQVHAPTRLMQARGDRSIPAAHADWLVAHLPNAELIWVDGDHFGPRDEPEMDLIGWVCGATA